MGRVLREKGNGRRCGVQASATLRKRKRIAHDESQRGDNCKTVSGGVRKVISATTVANTNPPPKAEEPRCRSATVTRGSPRKSRRTLNLQRVKGRGSGWDQSDQNVPPGRINHRTQSRGEERNRNKNNGTKIEMSKIVPKEGEFYRARGPWIKFTTNPQREGEWTQSRIAEAQKLEKNNVKESTTPKTADNGDSKKGDGNDQLDVVPEGGRWWANSLTRLEAYSDKGEKGQRTTASNCTS